MTTFEYGITPYPATGNIDIEAHGEATPEEAVKFAFAILDTVRRDNKITAKALTDTGVRA
jgi:hypothetical protein